MKKIFYYRDFGAKGDGVTNDFEAIRLTHEAANAEGADVEATPGATYYIGCTYTSAVIRTNVDWKDAIFYIDDTVVRWNDSKARTTQIFRVVSDKAVQNVPIPEGMTLTKGQANIGLTFDEPCMLYIENDHDRIYKRYGENANGGVPRKEIILVDEKGNVDPTTPIQYDYDAVTCLRAYSTTDTPITIRGGHIKTVTCDPCTYDPDYKNNYCYYYRGISVERSNTTLVGIRQTKEGEHEDPAYNYGSRGVPYAGTFFFKLACNVTFRDSTVQGHKAYSFFQDLNGKQVRNEMGSYTINAEHCIGLTLIGLTQIGDITDRAQYHGIMGSNFCRNTLLDGCYMDRFDSHQGMHNAVIRNCTLGFGILPIGGGDLIIENVTRLWGGEFITLRYDYNSVFDGDVYITSCTAEEPIQTLIGGNWIPVYNGLPNYTVRRVYINGLTLKHDGPVSVFRIRNATKEALSHEENPYLLPESITMQNVQGELIVSDQDVYDTVPVTCS